MAWAVNDELLKEKDSILSLFVGERLGSGASRHVYALEGDDTRVLKVEYVGRTFNNQTEWLVWEVVKEWPISDWFAPCYDIDVYGNVLIQARTEPFESSKDFHAAVRSTRGGVIPSVFDDVHYANFGMYDGRVTCHDYGYHKFFEQVARDMSIEAGYIKFDDPEQNDAAKPHDFTEGGQFVLNI